MPTWWVLAAVAVAFLLLFLELKRVSALLFRTISLLESVDAEVFHIAQEQNPPYGLCDNCHRRATVSHVIPREKPKEAVGIDGPDIFYCKACWWLSGSMERTDAGPRYYKDRSSERDREAAYFGPR